jgi:hypothetical protein
MENKLNLSTLLRAQQKCKQICTNTQNKFNYTTWKYSCCIHSSLPTCGAMLLCNWWFTELLETLSQVHWNTGLGHNMSFHAFVQNHKSTAWFFKLNNAISLIWKTGTVPCGINFWGNNPEQDCTMYQQVRLLPLFTVLCLCNFYWWPLLTIWHNIHSFSSLVFVAYLSIFACTSKTSWLVSLCLCWFRIQSDDKFPSQIQLKQNT